VCEPLDPGDDTTVIPTGRLPRTSYLGIIMDHRWIQLVRSRKGFG